MQNQVKADVESQGEFVESLATEVRAASFTNIEDLVAFVNWLDEELSFLVVPLYTIPSNPLFLKLDLLIILLYGGYENYWLINLSQATRTMHFTASVNSVSC